MAIIQNSDFVSAARCAVNWGRQGRADKPRTAAPATGAKTQALAGAGASCVRQQGRNGCRKLKKAAPMKGAAFLHSCIDKHATGCYNDHVVWNIWHCMLCL